MARVREDFRSLSGAEKAALLMLMLTEENAGKLFAKMHEDEIREVSQAMANLGAVHASLVEKMVQEFTEQLTSSGGLVGSFEATERLLAKTLPKDRVGAIMEEIRGPAGRTMWDKLGNVNEAVLANFLKNEYPQTVALVLSRINAPHAARVMTQLPESFAMEVVMRMLRMESVQKDVIEGVERTLRNEFMSNLARTSRRDAHEAMAEIFNSFDRANETRFVSALEERDREAAEKIKALMFTFEDLRRIPPQGLIVLLRTVEKDKLTLALKGSTEAMRDLFFKAMSDRAAKLLKEDLDALGPVRLRDVDEAQAAVVAAAKTLAQTGEIQISDGKEDELVY